MDFLDECRAERVTKGSPCRVSMIRVGMDADLRQQFEAAMADDAILATTISKVLLRHGIQIAAPILRRHRRGECHCE